MSQRHLMFPTGFSRPAHHSRLTQLGIAFLICGFLLTALELILRGAVTTPALGLGVIGVLLLPAGLIAQLIGGPHAGGQPDAEDDAGGGGGGSGPEPVLPPTGGLEVDWDRFEREFQAYADAQTLVGAGA